MVFVFELTLLLFELIKDQIPNKLKAAVMTEGWTHLGRNYSREKHETQEWFAKGESFIPEVSLLCRTFIKF